MRWGTRGKCYPGKGGRRKAMKQAIAIRASQRRRGKRTEPLTANVRNPLRMDPTRTATLRRRFSQDLSGRFLRLKSRVLRLVVDEDAFGLKLTVNFNPNQPRDKSGRWASGGGVGRIGEGADVDDEPSANVVAAIKHHTAVGAPGASRLKATDEQRAEMFEWVEKGQTTDELHRVLSFDSTAGAVDFSRQGVEFEAAKTGLFGSWSTDPDRAPLRGGAAFVRLRTEGTVTGRDISKHSIFPEEAEFVTPRNSRFRVKSVSTVAPGQFEAVVEEVGAGPRPKFIELTLGTNLALNQRFAFLTDQEKLAAFRLWVEEQVRNDILPILDETQLENAYWQAYVEDGYRKGAGRAFDDVKRPGLATTPEQRAFMAGTREEFLRSTLGQPVAIEKVKLLGSRVFTDLKGITQAMSTQLTRALADGLVQGASPRTVARNITRSIEGIGRNRALMLARTEIIRAHAEGALDAMENLGVDEVGVMVEWSTAGFNVCPKCRALDGVVLKVSEARGLFPRHPNCRCTPIPANVGEPKTKQIRGKRSIEKARDKSIKAELPKRKKRSLTAQRRRTSWLGASRRFSKKRPRSPV